MIDVLRIVAFLVLMALAFGSTMFWAWLVGIKERGWTPFTDEAKKNEEADS